MDVVGEVRHPARDPALPAARRRQATTCAATSSFSTRVDAAAWDDAASHVAARAPTRGDDVTVPLLRDGHRLPVDAEGARHRRAPTASPARCTSPAAGRTRASTSPASGSPSSAPARRASSRSRSSPQQAAQLTVFQRTPELLDPRAQRPRPAERAGRSSTADRDAYREAAKWSRGGVPVEPTDDHGGDALPTEERRRALRGGVARRASCSPSSASSPTRRSTRRPTTIVAEMIREKIRVDRRRPGDGRGAVPDGPLLRHQAAVPRHRLLRDLQPAARPAGRPAQAPDHDHHRDRHRHRRTSRSSSTPSSTPPASTR